MKYHGESRAGNKTERGMCSIYFAILYIKELRFLLHKRDREQMDAAMVEEAL